MKSEVEDQRPHHRVEQSGCQHGRRPMFFLLYHYMRHSEARTNKAYSALYGIASNKENSLKEVANMLSLSSERVCDCCGMH